ncbi:FAD-dependent oxidoreductase [Rhodococcus opacus]|uniref:FAD-dependent oxidoreductase n=1 Tax=Rhodococcus opacus TaxID=37919 RepID=UPI00247563D1|nr:FAD-dependent oxidoreductase [Rhodococcus opacus]MDH6291832.1 hypothetical protein [Rhodococcus opacus]
MTATEVPDRAVQLIECYRLPGSSVFMVGTFDKGITVLSQQIRALNLAWALVESGEAPLDREPGSDPGQPDGSRKRIAVVGAGFAGLTVAAGLLKKRANADITIFERRDTVLPLQHGSDSRWLHPHIYDWPSQGSEAYSAALPVLNWTASRASDVVVQVLKEWADVTGTDQPAPESTTSTAPEIRVFCNTKHIQVSNANAADSRGMTVEWIGEERDKRDPAIPATDRPVPVGDSQFFDMVILAVGFGLESGSRTSYWRNETLAQPHLGQARSTYIVSGSGDGAMIDVFRLRISHFRQDRILAELFAGHNALLGRLRSIHDSAPGGTGFEELRTVWEEADLADSANGVQDRLRDRLRQDTTVLLRVRNPSFANLFVDKRVSFQNRLLAYLLYRCGAFTPVTADGDADLSRLAEEHGVPEDRIIIRHGTEKKAGLTDVLADSLHEKIAECFETPDDHIQDDAPAWPGGYFDMPGLTEHAQGAGRRTKDQVKGQWRKEYLPSPMEAIATAFCSALTGYVASVTEPSSRLRVTLHRTLLSGDEVVLQQCCDYQGVGLSQSRRAGRTFPSHNGTIGAAFALRGVVRTKAGATKTALEADMMDMSLNEASQKMSDDVASVAAIPLLVDAASSSGQAGDVIGILYLDSYDEDAFVDDEMMGRVISMCKFFLGSLPTVAHTTAGRIANTEFWQRGELRDEGAHAIESANWQALELATIEAPRVGGLRHLNFDFSDFTPVEQT